MCSLKPELQRHVSEMSVDSCCNDNSFSLEQHNDNDFPQVYNSGGDMFGDMIDCDMGFDFDHFDIVDDSSGSDFPFGSNSSSQQEHVSLPQYDGSEINSNKPELKSEPVVHQPQQQQQTQTLSPPPPTTTTSETNSFQASPTDESKTLHYKERYGRDNKSVKMTVPSTELDKALEVFAKSCLGVHARDDEITKMKLRCWTSFWEVSSSFGIGNKRPRIEVDSSIEGVHLDWSNPQDEGKIVLGKTVLSESCKRKRSVDRRVRQALRPCCPPFKSFVGTSECFIDTHTLHDYLNSTDPGSASDSDSTEAQT